MRMDQWRARAGREKPWKLIAQWTEAYGETPALEKLKNTAVFHADMAGLFERSGSAKRPTCAAPPAEAGSRAQSG